VLVLVGVSVSVGVKEAVLVKRTSVRLPVAVWRLSVPVAVAVRGVLDVVGVTASGFGAVNTAINPRQ